MKYILVLSCILATAVAQNDVQSNMVILHNGVRITHRVGTVQGDNTLAGIAQKCSVYYAAQNKIDHTCPYAAEFGENLGQTSYSDTLKSAKDSFAYWYNEKKAYNYIDPDSSNFDDIGHFTQVVWKGTNKIGCGAAVNAKTKNSFVVCLYDPPGNYEGEYQDNVFPPK